MKIDFNQVIMAQDGKPMKFALSSESKELTDLILGKLCSSLLDPVDPAIGGEDKYKRGKLCFKLFSADELDLKVDEIALIKKVIGEKANNSAVVFQAWDMLEKKDIAKEVVKEVPKVE